MSEDNRTFIGLCDEVDGLLNTWRPLSKYLGMTPEEYALWVDRVGRAEAWLRTRPNNFSWNVAIDSLAGVARERHLEAKLAAALTSLSSIDKRLTTVKGDNVPRGEACKLHVRAIARSALGCKCAEV